MYRVFGKIDGFHSSKRFFLGYLMKSFITVYYLLTYVRIKKKSMTLIFLSLFRTTLKSTWWKWCFLRKKMLSYMRSEDENCWVCIPNLLKNQFVLEFFSDYFFDKLKNRLVRYALQVVIQTLYIVSWNLILSDIIAL